MHSRGRGLVSLSNAERALICGVVAGFCKELKALFSADPDAERAEQFARFTVRDTAPPATGSKGTRTFIETIAEAKQSVVCCAPYSPASRTAA